mmetsp:Transcript_98752/g.195786  ORF Transcript_98752/g.195786 Transcript_98752/m.195786 type:complete len:125 (+) Transcript_98752:67-441(+)|eukprot:CAMPEP_0172790834 /NCGR_PEP_ID=MMETSP1074-20121228/208166_1 /TAXON_ID=2916 /ORGANISM="Ceratium fusus, Strain PA161109" /LENGTH=124 /DNA_ID=CAMNT_0013627887 /DNA_START=424 /DNA_END=798 /DNA_ORIENTATION=-
MFGIIRTAVAVCRLSASRLPNVLNKANTNSLPFIPTDWVFRFAPYICRDRVRFMLRFNQISFGTSLAWFYLFAHAPYTYDHYEGFYESPLYNFVKGNLERSGQLEENLRVKVHHFYPQTEEAEE